MQSTQHPAALRPAVALVGANGELRVRATMPARLVAAMLTANQLRSVTVVDEYGVQVGIVSLADLVPSTDALDPIFAGLARRQWYDLPEAATAGDLMTHVAAVTPDRRTTAAA